jgi:hypothetical protein
MLKNERVLCFVPKFNSEGKKDATGAFQPEAATFIKLAKAGSEIYLFDNSVPLPVRRKEVLAKLKASVNKGFTSVSFFCHGWQDGIQAGYTRKSVAELAQAINEIVYPKPNSVAETVVIPLYCCSTGEDPQDDPLTAAGTGDDSFADKLRDALCAVGQVNCRVMGHTTVAHTTRNPMVLFMDGMGIPTGGVGGYPPVSPKSANWTAWKKALQNSDLRFRMPYMSPAEIHDELSNPLSV